MIQLHTATQAPGACSASGQGTMSWLCPCEGWWSRGPDLRNLPVHLQNPGDLVPKICGWAPKKEIKDILIQYDHTILVAACLHSKSQELSDPDAHDHYQKFYQKAHHEDQDSPF